MDKQSAGGSILGFASEFVQPLRNFLSTARALKSPSINPAHKVRMLAEYNKQKAALKAAFLWTAGGTGAAVGGGALYSALTDKISDPKAKERKKIQTSLALQELQSDTGSEESVFGKKSGALGNIAAGGALTAGALIPAAISYKYLRDMEASKKKQKIIGEIKALRKEYDNKFKSSVLEDMHVVPADLKSTVAEMNKVSNLYKMAIQKESGYQAPLALSALGAGLGMAAFTRGKKKGEENSPNFQQMKGYREMLDRVTRMRNAPVIVSGGAFSPEEMVALNKLRSESPKKKTKTKADAIKDTKGGTAPKKVSAKTGDPQLQELLGSI